MAAKKNGSTDCTKSLLFSLCETLVQNREKLEDDIWKSNLLKVPNYLQNRPFKNQDNVTKHLFRTSYDLLLLRRSEWYNKWRSPLSPDCRCLAYGYQLQQCGRQEEVNRLMTLIDSDVLTSYEYSNEVLTFLAILANKDIPITPCNAVITDDGGYAIYPKDIFEALPGSVNLQYSNDKFLTRPPGTGLMGFCTQNDLQDDLQSCDSALFSGLTHTTTPTLNTVLHIPSLTDQPPPDMLDRFLNRYKPTKKSLPVVVPLNDSGIQCDSVIDLIDRVGDIGEAPPISWEGQLEYNVKPYLSESGPEAFAHSSNAYLILTAETGGVQQAIPTTTPPLNNPRRSIDSVSSMMTTLAKCELIEDKLRNNKFADGICKNLFDCVCCVLKVCRVKVDQLTADNKECTDIGLQFHARAVRRLVGYAEQLMNLCSLHSISGLKVLNSLYKLCINNEGLPTYRLMLGVWLHAIKPYLSGIEVWVYSGQYLKHSNVLGIVTDNRALEMRDHTYWAKAFTLNPADVPGCFSKLAMDVLNTGRSLNLLNLICPKHHLCNGRHRTPQLMFVETLQELTDNIRLYNEYKHSMEAMEELYREQKKAELEEERLLTMAPIIQARREAQQFMDNITRREMEEEITTENKKRTLLLEQKREIERARAYHMEMEAIESEEDKLALDQPEKDERKTALLEEMKGELIDYYQRLSKEAELRLARAQWRAKRFALATSRIQQHNDNRGKALEDDDIDEGRERDSTGSDVSIGTEHIVKGSENIEVTEEKSIEFQAVSRGSKVKSRGSEYEAESKGTEDVQDVTFTPDEDTLDKGDSHMLKAGFTHVSKGSEDIDKGSDSSEDMTKGSEELLEQEVDTDTNDKGSPVLAMPRPHPSLSTVQDLLYNSGQTQTTMMTSSRGEAPSSTIQEIMYPDNITTVMEPDRPGEPNEGTPPDDGTPSSKGTPPIEGLDRDSYREDEVVSVLEDESCIASDEGSSAEDKGSSSQDKGFNVEDKESNIEGAGSSVEGKEGSSTGGIGSINGSISHDPSASIDDTENVLETHTPYKKYTIDMALSSALPFGDALDAPPPSTDPSLLLCSLDTVIDMCLVQPISIQCGLVNSALINHFVNELDVKGHFMNLKNFLFLEDGEFSNVLSSALFEKLMYDTPTVEVCSISFLQPLLMLALERSRSSNLIPNMELKAKYRPNTIQSASVKVLGFLHLMYRVEWPMNIVIREYHIQKYNEVFHLILEIKRCSWMLKHVFLRLSRGGHHSSNTISHVQLRLIHAQRQELQHFVTVMEGYISNQIFHVTWKNFESKMDKISSLDELISCHDDYLTEVMSKCLLIRKTQSVLNLIEECLACVVKFSAHFLSRDHFQLTVLSSVYKKFHDISSLLFKVINKLIERGYQPHLEDLLLRMNFNKYYK